MEAKKSVEKGFFFFFLSIAAACVLPFPSYADSAPRILSFSTIGPSVDNGAPMKFFWDARNVDQCYAQGGWSGNKSVTGTEDVPAPTQTTTYTLSCQRNGIADVKSFTVYMNPTHVPFLFNTPTTEVILSKGRSLTLDWSAPFDMRWCNLNLNGLLLNDRWIAGSEPVVPSSTGRSLYSIECRRSDATTAQASISITVYPDLPKYYMNFTMAQFGEKYGDLTLAAIQPYSPGLSTSATNFQIHLKGRTTVSGTYRYYPTNSDNIFLRSRVCMDSLDAASFQRIPHVLGVDQSGQRFCFRNDAFAREVFGPSFGFGYATVVIDGYTLVNEWEHRPDEAYLSSVVSKKILAPITYTIVPEPRPVAAKQASAVVRSAPKSVAKVVTKKASTPKKVQKKIVRRAPVKKATPKPAEKKTEPQKPKLNII